MRRFLTALALVLMLVPAYGTIFKRFTITEVEDLAERILVATVKTKSEFAATPPDGPVVTEVVFTDLTVLEGDDPGATVSYRFAGGRSGERRYFVVGVPEFEIGERYVLFLLEPAPGMPCPLVGWWQGRYRVLPPVEGTEPTIADSEGRSVYGFTNGFPVVTPPDEKARPLTLAAFRGLLEELARQRALRGEEETR